MIWILIFRGCFKHNSVPKPHIFGPCALTAFRKETLNPVRRPENKKLIWRAAFPVCPQEQEPLPSISTLFGPKPRRFLSLLSEGCPAQQDTKVFTTLQRVSGPAERWIPRSAPAPARHRPRGSASPDSGHRAVSPTPPP